MSVDVQAEEKLLPRQGLDKSPAGIFCKTSPEWVIFSSAFRLGENERTEGMWKTLSPQ